MKMICLKCPNCNANLEYNDNVKVAKCGYCGTKIILDDGVKRMEYTYREIKEAEIENARARMRESDNDREVRFREYEYMEKRIKRIPLTVSCSL